MLNNVSVTFQWSKSTWFYIWQEIMYYLNMIAVLVCAQWQQAHMHLNWFIYLITRNKIMNLLNVYMYLSGHVLFFIKNSDESTYICYVQVASMKCHFGLNQICCAYYLHLDDRIKLVHVCVNNSVCMFASRAARMSKE